ncbi:MAG: LysM peptidoglycan-binding domain-containing protein [Anaerolineales bacterium]|nr:LysM peptidoglycan-binding domain-containing protein [Anaerolineales bacterium]
MRSRCFASWFLLLIILMGIFPHPQVASAAPSNQVTAYDLIIAMNTLRVAYGLPPLIEDPIINAVAQSTAATMAASNMSWHIGDVRGRIAAAGYGAGGTVWATENFAVGSAGYGIDQIMATWADPDHMRPAVTSEYCHVGAGTAQTSDGRTYYILQAAYVSGQECGSSTSSGGGVSQPGSIPSFSGLIVPVKIAEPDAEGKVFHEVQMGQSLWAIAIAYQITIHDIEVWNNISRDDPLQAGQRLFIPNENTAGYATPTPYGMIVPQTPDVNGKIVHEVAPYQALITIADAYQVSVEKIISLNGIQADTPLQVGQQLVISLGNITPSPTLSNIQKLTPEADGKYYHMVQSGETLSWIAGLYDVSLSSLMAWNGMNNESVIYSGQRLLLQVTPPPTLTPASTATLTPSPTLSPTPSATSAPTGTPLVAETNSSSGFSLAVILGILALVLGGFMTWWAFSSRNKEDEE